MEDLQLRPPTFGGSVFDDWKQLVKSVALLAALGLSLTLSLVSIVMVGSFSERLADSNDDTIDNGVAICRLTVALRQPLDPAGPCADERIAARVAQLEVVPIGTTLDHHRTQRIVCDHHRTAECDDIPPAP